MSILTSPYLLVTSGLIAFLMQFFFELTYISTNTPPGLEDDNTAITRNLNILQSHPSCGIPSGGREECWWNCTRCFNAFFQDPLCLESCHMPCIKSLIADYKSAGGVCPSNGYLQCEYSETNTQTCDVSGYDQWGSAIIQRGVCSEETERLLLEEECFTYLKNNKYQVWLTIQRLVETMCTYDTWLAIGGCGSGFCRNPLAGSGSSGTSGESVGSGGSANSDEKTNNSSRLLPITVVDSNFGGQAYGISDLVNTRNRYPWICSLRAKSNAKPHICGVTILSIPPSPTVLISAAHCVTVCRSKAMDKLLPNCCCDNVGGEICYNDPDNECGDDPEVVNMTGDDAEIICGEWETGPTPMSESEEEYNIILPIKTVTRHPNYSISRGEARSQFVINDLAIFIVDDKELKKKVDEMKHSIVPICLPSTSHQTPTTAIHSGWSSPPPLEFLEQNLPFYVPYHQEFFKQWHYAMNVVRCEDPNPSLKYPSNSSYPPGVVCAVEKYNEFCPSAGESGSPLMFKEDGKYTLSGIQSFIKGCSTFTYSFNSPSDEKSGIFLTRQQLPPTEYSLTQESLNPSVYAKISCYLPWIADQYGMTYEAEENNDPDCVNYTGDIDEITAENCTTIPTKYALAGHWEQEQIDNVEAQCIFNFTVDDREWDGCMISGIQDFTHPVFKCPIRSIKNRNSPYYFTNYTLPGGQQVNEVVNAIYCPTNCISVKVNSFGTLTYFFNSGGPVFGTNGEYELDPENRNCTIYAGYGPILGLPVFGTCKNNCRGVNFPVVSGGFALLAILTSQTQALGALGLGGTALFSTSYVGGAAALLGLGAASQMCLAPFMCTTVTGECCEIFFNEGRIRCPITCNADLKRQSDVTASNSAQNGYSLSNIFSTTLVTTLMYNVLNSITATISVPTATTTTTTMTTTLSPIITTTTGNYGSLKSINFPNNYLNDYEEHYIITVEDGSKVSLYFESFDIENHPSCIYDYIEVFNSDDEYPIVKACGTTPPNLIVSSSNRLRLNFKTDGSRNATGFKASWTIETVYSITSPDYPLPYLGVANSESWTLPVDEGLRIKITFLHMDIARNDENCNFEYIQVDELTKHCGSTSKPWSIITRSNNLTVIFQSDDSGWSGTGFLALLEATTEPPTFPTPTGCESCTFPFTYGEINGITPLFSFAGITFDTCISFMDIDAEPWCSYDTLPPIDEGYHVFAKEEKITCSSSDSSCPSTPPQMLLSSPNYPNIYPNNLNKTWTLEVDEGKRINITFLDFDIRVYGRNHVSDACVDDWVELDNFSKHCGYISQPWSIISNSNTLNVTLVSSDRYSRSHGIGFIAIWSATSEPPTYPPEYSTGCSGCRFPFTYDNFVFDTCTSIYGTQPLCLAGPPVNEGFHVIEPRWYYCSDSDSTCPSTPQMISHPDNEAGNCYCGIPNSGNGNTRIIDGVKTNIGEYPWQVALLYNSPYLTQQFCGGSLISEKHVLTSASCAYFAYYYVVYVHLGDTILGNDMDVTYTNTIAVTNFFIHQDYVNEFPYSSSNIAILEMAEPVPLDLYPNIKPACLPDQGADFLGYTATLSGWGLDGVNGYNTWLHEAQVSVVADEQCFGISPSEICATGTLQGSEAPCVRDDGGALVISDPNINNNGLTVAGIISVEDCYEGETYTRVSFFVNWINGIIGDTATCPPPQSTK